MELSASWDLELTLRQLVATPHQTSSTAQRTTTSFIKWVILLNPANATIFPLVQGALDSGATTADIARDHFSLWCQYGRSFDRYRQTMEPHRSWVTRVYFLWGPTGSGKSRFCNEQGEFSRHISNPQLPYSPANSGAVPCRYQPNGDFIMGYDGEPVVVFEETDPAPTFLEPRLLELLDRYRCLINIKGGSRNLGTPCNLLHFQLPPHHGNGGHRTCTSCH